MVVTVAALPAAAVAVAVAVVADVAVAAAAVAEGPSKVLIGLYKATGRTR